MITGMQQQIWEVHEQSFNFFQSKPINYILFNRKSQPVIHFRDIEFMDDDVEYLKRYYIANQSMVRLQRLISYYEDHMMAPSPNLIPFRTSILHNWKRKQVKLAAMHQHSVINMEAKSDQQPQSHVDNLLPLLQNSHFSELEKSQAESVSYDSSIHDIYQQMIVEESSEAEADLFQRKINHQFELVIDFKGLRNAEPTSSRVVPRNHQSLKPAEMPRNRIQPTGNQVSFMEYYNTVSKKTSPTRLLNKYIHSNAQQL